MIALLSASAVLATAQPDPAQFGTGHKAMDLVSSERDLNGFPRDPDWYGQSAGPHGSHDRPDIDAGAVCDYFRNDGGTLRVERCTTQAPRVDERRPIRGVVPDVAGYLCRFAHDKREEIDRDSVHGHINWEVASYSGLVYFDDLQDPRVSFHHLIPGDGDLDFTLVRADHRGYVKGTATQDQPGHDAGIVLEANLYELGDLATPWWSDMRRSFETDSNFVDARRNLFGVSATAVGLLGIDTKHGTHTELHPLFALFARTTAEGALPQHWIFFARNWGYEGGCSTDLHHLGRDALTVEIPAPPSAVIANTVVSPATARDWLLFQSGPGTTIMTVRFPSAVIRPVVVGQFDVCDGACPATPFRGAATVQSVNAAGVAEADRERVPEEARLEPLLAMLTDDQRSMFFAHLRAHAATTDPSRELYEAFRSAAGGARRAQDILRMFETNHGVAAIRRAGRPRSPATVSSDRRSL